MTLCGYLRVISFYRQPTRILTSFLTYTSIIDCLFDRQRNRSTPGVQESNLPFLNQKLSVSPLKPTPEPFGGRSIKHPRPCLSRNCAEWIRTITTSHAPTAIWKNRTSVWPVAPDYTTAQNHGMIYIIFNPYVNAITINIANDCISRSFSHDHKDAAVKINAIITLTVNNAPSIIVTPLL